jgi:crotonobetainyl-CoA:carnitine CoA-transferase CaiB-like acyl-CoA transferase
MTSTEAGLPLRDIRVIDLTRVMSGPFSTVMLAELGAEVIKIEGREGDITRVAGGHMRNGVTAMFLALNRGKKSFAVDLTSMAGQAAVRRLVSTADVFIENFRPGVADAMGFGAESLRADNPRLVYLSINGYGRDGAMKDAPAYDTVIQGQTGMISRQSSGPGQVDKVRSFPVDKLSGMFATQAVLAALFDRERTGTGCVIDVPMFDATMYYLWSDVLAEQTFTDGNFTSVADTWRGPGVSKTADRDIVYLIVSLKERHGLLRAVGRPELADDERFATVRSCMTNQREYQAIVAEAMVTMPSTDLVAAMKANGVAATIVMEAEEVVADPDLTGGDFFAEWNHPRAGRIRQPRNPIRFNRQRQMPPALGAELGEHTEELLLGTGYTADEIQSMRVDGVI